MDAAAMPPMNMPFLTQPVDDTPYQRIVRAAGELRDDKDAAERALQEIRDIMDARDLEAQRQVDDAKAALAAELDRLQAEHANELIGLTEAHEAAMVAAKAEADARHTALEQEVATLTTNLARVIDLANAWVARTEEDLGAELYADAGRRVLDRVQAGPQ